MVAKGELLELNIDSAAFEGAAVARHDSFVLFVRNAVPGDKVMARVLRKRKKHAEAVVEEVLSPSPVRVDPRCPYFETCGGCTWQNLDYSSQLEAKRTQVADLFRRIGRLEVQDVAETVPSPDIFYYRNKMEFTFGSSRWLTKAEIAGGEKLKRDFALGLHIPKRFDKILDLDTCFLQSETSAEIVNSVRALCLEEGWSPYNTLKHSGFLRNLVIRVGSRTGELLVNLVTSRWEAERAEAVRDRLLGSFPVTTLINSINSTRSPVAAGDEKVLHGPGFIRDRIGAFDFSIGTTTFFQPNTVQAERLYEIVKDWAALKGSELVFDLYCGIGSISLFIAAEAAEVVGFDHHQQSISDAVRNAEANGVAKCRFIASDARQVFKGDIVRSLGQPDLVILDPPRSGLHPDVCSGLLETRPARIIYISCNPATQARDIAAISDDYTIERVQPVDMFPHTHHIENVVLLRLKV